MSGVQAGRVVKLKTARRAKSRAVVRMMAIMQDGSNNEELPKEFVEGGRTGRRNAMPDILHPPDVHASTADLPSRLQQLATTVTSSDLSPYPRETNYTLVSPTDVQFERDPSAYQDPMLYKNQTMIDPNNPQPGPSTQPAEDKTNDPQKKDSVS